MTDPAPAPITLEAVYNLLAQTRQAVYENMDRTDALNERVTAVLLEEGAQNANLGPMIIPKLERALAKIEQLEKKIAALESARGALSPSVQRHMAPLSGDYTPGADFYDAPKPSEDQTWAPGGLLPIVPVRHVGRTLHAPFPLDIGQRYGITPPSYEADQKIIDENAPSQHPQEADEDVVLSPDATSFTPEQCRDPRPGPNPEPRPTS